MDANLPAPTEERAVPAVAEPVAEPPPTTARGQNVTTGIFPLALGVLVLVFLALAFWTVMATTGGGL
jgi:hypothetical protein